MEGFLFLLSNSNFPSCWYLFGFLRDSFVFYYSVFLLPHVWSFSYLVLYIFPVGLRELILCVLRFILSVTVGSSWLSVYDTNNTLQCLFNSIWCSITFYLGKYFIEITFSSGSAFNLVITKKIRLIIIWYGRQ